MADDLDLVIHVDINETVILFDSAQNLNIVDTLKRVIAKNAWGVCDKEKIDDETKWSPVSSVLSRDPPTNDRHLITFKRYLDEVHPNSDLARNDRVFRFISEEGKIFAPEYIRLLAALNIENESHPPHVGLLPSFLTFVVTLCQQRRAFRLVFRTFGGDLPFVAIEWNLFCCGNHPDFPDFRADDVSESQGGYRDLRLDLECGGGTFFRCGPSLSDVLFYPRGCIEPPSLQTQRHLLLDAGWLGQIDSCSDDNNTNLSSRLSSSSSSSHPLSSLIPSPSVDLDFNFEHSRKKLSSDPRLEPSASLDVNNDVTFFAAIAPSVDKPDKTVVTVAPVAPQFNAWIRARHVSAVRDHYEWWALNQHLRGYGKVLFLEEQPPSSVRREFHVFFDDNIARAPSRRRCIVDPRHVRSGEPVALEAALGVHLLHVNTFRAIVERAYFLDELAAAERRFRLVE